MSSTILSPIQVTVFYVLLGIGMFVLLGYAYEYVRYKTLRTKRRRWFNLLFCGWFGVMGIFGWVSISPVLGIIFIGLAFLSYFWDRWIVDKMP